MSVTVPYILEPGQQAVSGQFNANWAYCLAAVGALPATANLDALGVFNVAFYGVTNLTDGVQNQSFFNDALVSAAAFNGGTLLIPNFGVDLAMTGTISTNPVVNQAYSNVIIKGVSGEQTLSKTDGTDCILIDNQGAGNQDAGGQAVSDITVKYANGLTTGAGIHILGAQNTFVERVVVTDAPVGYQFDNTLTCGAFNCSANYNHNLANNIGFLITGPAGHTNAANQIRLDRVTTIFENAGTGTSMGMQNTQCVHSTVFDSYFTGAPTGIAITPSAMTQNDVQQTAIIATQVGAPQNGIIFQPLSATGSKIQTFWVIGGQVQGGSAATGTSVGIFIDTNGAASNWVTDGKLIGAICESWGLYGLQINVAQNIQVIGGTFSSNGTAGIAITGAAGNFVTISDADLSASYQGGTAQTYALLVSGNPAYVLVRGCPMLGYGASPVHVTGSPTKLIIKDCPGYNYQKTAIVTANSLPMSPSSASAQGYYGMSRYTLGTSASGYVLNGASFAAAPGTSLWLDPYDTINSVGSSNGTWIGY